MSRFLPPLAIKLLAVFLLVLDLSQEPVSALPAPTPADNDSNTVTELATKEDFHWDGSAAVGHELNLAILAEQSWIRADRGQSPSVRALPPTDLAAVGIFAPHHSAYVLPVATAPPSGPAVERTKPPLAALAFHRNTYLAQRPSVLLIV